MPIVMKRCQAANHTKVLYSDRIGEARVEFATSVYTRHATEHQLDPNFIIEAGSSDDEMAVLLSTFADQCAEPHFADS